MAATLDRVEAVNPKVNAIVALRPRDELMAEAEALDHRVLGREVAKTRFARTKVFERCSGLSRKLLRIPETASIEITGRVEVAQ